MDSLKIISDINSHITTLDEKVEKTSKSASLAFSYLYGKFSTIDNFTTLVENLDNKVDEINNDVEKSNLYSYSYYSTLKANVADVALSASTIKNSVRDEFDKINERIESIENELSLINDKLIKIIDCPEKFIVVKQEPPIIIKFFMNIHNWLYRLFHAKQIKETQERIIKEEQERKAEQERKLKEETERRRIAEEKEKQEKKNKIKSLLGK